MEGTVTAAHGAEVAGASPLEKLPEEIQALQHHLSSLDVGSSYLNIAGIEFHFTNYLFFLIIGVLLVLTVVFLGVKKIALVPKSKVSNAVEALAEFVRNDIAIAQIGHGSDKYLPFLTTVFFFILINNVIGLIPGSKPGTGTMGVTVALATFVFAYYNIAGVKAQGGLKYLLSFAPKGVPFPMNALVWVIEVFSAFLRILTLSVRLFANMFAGHLILGIFALLTALFFEPLLEQFSTGTLLGALPSAGWLLLMTALYTLEVLVAALQAYIFTLLSAVYIGQAVHEH